MTGSKAKTDKNLYHFLLGKSNALLMTLTNDLRVSRDGTPGRSFDHLALAELRLDIADAMPNLTVEGRDILCRMCDQLEGAMLALAKDAFRRKHGD